MRSSNWLRLDLTPTINLVSKRFVRIVISSLAALTHWSMDLTLWPILRFRSHRNARNSSIFLLSVAIVSSEASNNRSISE